VVAAIGPFAWTVVLVFLRPAHRLIDPLFLPKANELGTPARQERMRRKEAALMTFLLLLFTTASVTVAIVTL